jgi:hypothetical protein
MMKRAAWAILAVLALGPAVKADTFTVTSGYFLPLGSTPVSYFPSGDNLFMYGDGFTAVGNIQFAPINCYAVFAPGAPITGCESDFFIGLVTVTTSSGVEIPITFGYDFLMNIGQADMQLSGATQATLTEPAQWEGFTGCINVAFDPDCPHETLFIPGPVTLTMDLTQDPSTGGYDVTSEKYIISTPEPGMIVLVGIGLVGLALRRRFA